MEVPDFDLSEMPFADAIDLVKLFMATDSRPPREKIDILSAAFRESPDAYAIMREIGRYLYDSLTAEQREEIEQHQGKIEKLLLQARTSLNNQSYQMAKELATEYLACVGDGQVEDTQNVYISFDFPIEEDLFKSIYHPEKQVLRAPLSRSQAHYIIGAAEFGMGNYVAAERELIIARNLNPVAPRSFHELGEVHKVQGDFTAFKEVTNEALRVSYTPQYLARGYRNLAYLAIEEEDYQTAIDLLALSTNIEPEWNGLVIPN